MQLPTTEKKREAIINVLYYSLFTAVAFFGLQLLVRYLLPALYPFIIAYAISLVLNPPMHFLKRKAGLPVGVAAFILVTLTVALVFVLGYFAVERAVDELGRLSRFLSGDLDTLRQSALAILESIPLVDGEKLLASLGERVDGLLPSLDGLLTIITGLFGGLLDLVLSFAVTTVACYYMTVERASVSGFFYKLCPQSMQKHLRTVRVQIFDTLWKYLKAYGLIMLITFAQLFLAFTLLRLDYALVLAAVISLIDILPVLGTGTVLIPWGIVCITVTRDVQLGIWLIVIYIVITVIRQILEPKIVGGYIGMHPLGTMVAMFAGLKLFGFVGMLLLPFALLTTLNIVKVANAHCGRK